MPHIRLVTRKAKRWTTEKALPPSWREFIYRAFTEPDDRMLYVLPSYTPPPVAVDVMDVLKKCLPCVEWGETLDVFVTPQQLEAFIRRLTNHCHSTSGHNADNFSPVILKDPTTHEQIFP